jgi:hypothetical protein
MLADRLWSPRRTVRCSIGRAVRAGVSHVRDLLGRRGAVLCWLAALLVGASRPAQSQLGNITAEVTVRTPLQVSGVWSLEFQTVRRNRLTTVAPTNVFSGAFSVTGHAGAQIAVTFTLPTSLTRVGGTQTMPIGSYTGCIAAVYPLGGNPCTTFTPSAAPTNATLTGGLRWFYLGATVDTRGLNATQLPDGSYRAFVVMSAAYTGN